MHTTSPFTRIGTATMLVAALMGTTLSTPAIAQEPAVKTGSFNWGIRKGLVSYVEGPIGRGTAMPIAPATSDKNGIYKEFQFPVDAAAAQVTPNGDATIALQGGVHLQAHPKKVDGQDAPAYDLDVKFTDLKLQISGKDGKLTADYLTKGDFEQAGVPGASGQGVKEGNDVTVMTFTLDEAIDPSVTAVNYNNIPTISQQGFVDAMVNRYNVGESLDAAELHLKLSGNKDGKDFGNRTSVDDENRGKIIGGSIAGILLLLGGIFAALVKFLPSLGVKLPF